MTRTADFFNADLPRISAPVLKLMVTSSMQICHTCTFSWLELQSSRVCFAKTCKQRIRTLKCRARGLTRGAQNSRIAKQTSHCTYAMRIYCTNRMSHLSKQLLSINCHSKSKQMRRNNYCIILLNSFINPKRKFP